MDNSPLSGAMGNQALHLEYSVLPRNFMYYMGTRLNMVGHFELFCFSLFLFYFTEFGLGEIIQHLYRVR